SLISRFTLLYSPSLSVFLHCTKVADEKSAVREEHLLAVGNPRFDASKFKDVAYLPNAETEVAGLSKEYDRARVLVGPNATKQQFLSEIKHADVVHFAGHYFVVSGSPGSSYMLLAGNGTDQDSNTLTNDE